MITYLCGFGPKIYLRSMSMLVFTLSCFAICWRTSIYLFVIIIIFFFCILASWFDAERHSEPCLFTTTSMLLFVMHILLKIHDLIATEKFNFFHLNLLMKLAAICETSFHYQDKIRPSNYVVNVALNMQVTSYIFIGVPAVNWQLHFILK